MTEQATGFRDPTSLTRTTKGFLYASIPLVLLSIANSWRDYRWLSSTGEPAPPLEGPFLAVAGLALPAMVVTLGTAIMALMWIHRANYNARQLGASGLKFTPGWAVGWYFIPIASLWKPYQAMKEICQASFNPSGWWDEDAPSLVPLWWGLWLVTLGGSSISFTVSTEVAESASDVFREVLRVPLTLVFLSIINRVHSMQMASYRTRGGGASARSSTAVP